MDTHGRPPRLKGWDYSKSGAYFVTFVVGERRPILRVPNGRLSPAGRRVLEVWRRLPLLNPRVRADELAIMGDHVHAVIFLTDHPTDRADLGTVVRRWKAASTRAIRISLPKFRWQSHYQDWVVRSQASLNRIRRYVRENHRRADEGRNSLRPGP